MKFTEDYSEFDLSTSKKESLGVSDYVLDIAASVPRGLESMAHGVYNLGDFLSFDVLPDWDEQRLFGRSKTMAGDIATSLVQFAVPFGAIGKGISVAGKAARAGKLTGVTGKAAKALTKGKKPGKFTDVKVTGLLGAELATDFAAFDGQEQRLANLLTESDNPAFNNAVTQYLAADPEDSELEGRLKNVIEGQLVGLGLAGLFKGFTAGLDAIKVKNTEVSKGATREDAITSAMFKWQDQTKGEAFADLPSFAEGKKFVREPLTEEDVLKNKSLFMWDSGYSLDEIKRTLKIDKKRIQDYLLDIGEDPRDFSLGRKDTGFEVTRETQEAIGMNVALKMWDEGYSPDEISKTVNLEPEFIEQELISLGEDVRDIMLGRKDKGFDTGLDAFELSKRREDTALNAAIDMWQEGYSIREISKAVNFPEERLMDELVTMGESPKDFRGRRDRPFAEMPEFREKQVEPELQQKLDDLGETIEDFDEAIDRRPGPFKTYEEEAMMDIIPKGAGNLKSRLMKKFPIKGADPEDVADVEKFIDVMGQRLFGDVSLSVTNKIPSAGRYNFGNNLLQIRQATIDKGEIKRTMVHELWHSLSRYLPSTDVDSLTKQFQKERQNYLDDLSKRAKDKAKTPSERIALAKELNGFKKGEFTSDNYRYADVDEYFAEEMTDAFLKKLDEKDLAPQGTLKRIAQEVAIMFKDMFASLKAKLGIDQRQKIFNDFIKQRNIKIQRQRPLEFGRTFAEMPEFSDDIIKKSIDDVSVKSIRTGGRQAIDGVAKAVANDFDIPSGAYADEIMAMLDAGAEKLQGSNQVAKYTQEMLDEGVLNEMADATGADGNFLKGLVNQYKNDAVQLRRIALRHVSLRAGLTKNGQEIIKLAEEYNVGRAKLGEEELEILEARIKSLIDLQLHIQAGVSGLSSGFGFGLKTTQMKARIGLDRVEITDRKLRNDYLRKKGGLTIDQIVENILFAKAKGGDDVWNTIIGMNNTIRGHEGGKFLKMVEEYYKNALMWGPRTITVNAGGGFMSTSVKQFERYVGGWMSADPATKKAITHASSKNFQLTGLVRFMLNAWKSGDYYIGDARSAFVEQTEDSIGSITGKNVGEVLGTELSDGLETAIDWIGKAVRLPNRTNQAWDQMYKFNEYRTRAETMLRTKAMDLGIQDPEKIAEYTADAMQALLTRSNRNFSEANLIKEAQASVKDQKFDAPSDREKAIYEYVEQAKKETAERSRRLGLVDESSTDFEALDALTRDFVEPNLASADEITFSTELGKNMQLLQKFVSGFPGGFIVAPFIRTPTNILKFSFSRLGAWEMLAFDKLREKLPLVAPEYKARIERLRKGMPATEDAKNSILEQLNAVKADGTPDHLKRAEVKGKLAFSALLNGAMMVAVFNFKDRINGQGPKDFKQRKIWEAAGNVPYSIKIGDKWISYGRLDPIATMIGMYADTADLMEDGKMHSVDDNVLMKLASSMTLALTRNATNKSYLAGIDNFFKAIFDPESTTAGKYGGTVVGGFIPNIFNQGQSITGDQQLEEARTFADVVLKRIPGTTLDLKRNPLGEPVVQEYFEGVAGVINPLNPVMWGSASNDSVMLELAKVGHGFSAPSTKLDGVIDLLDYEQANGRSAYDRWMELHSEVTINGFTMRQAFEKLFADSRYQALDATSYSGLPSPRVEYIQRIMSRYRSRARMQMLQEFPELLQQQNQIKAAKRQGSQQDVLALLTQ